MSPQGFARSCRSLHQIADAHQIVHRPGKGEHPADSPHTTELDLAQQPYGFQPAEDLFNPFPFLLTDRLAGVPRGRAINRPGTVRRMLGHMRRDLPRPQILNELVGVIVLLAAQRDASGGGLGLDQGHRLLPLRRPGCRRHRGVDDQAVPVLHQHMAKKAQLRLLARGLLLQPAFGIGGRRVRGIRPPLDPEVHTRVAQVISRRRSLGLLLKTLLARPGLDQGAVDGELLIGEEALGRRVRQDLLEERRGHRAEIQVKKTAAYLNFTCFSWRKSET